MSDNGSIERYLLPPNPTDWSSVPSKHDPDYRDNYSSREDHLEAIESAHAAIERSLLERAARVVPGAPIEQAAEVLRLLWSVDSLEQLEQVIDWSLEAGYVIDRAGLLEQARSILEQEWGTYTRPDLSLYRVPAPIADHAVNRKRADGTARGRRAGSIVDSSVPNDYRGVMAWWAVDGHRVDVPAARVTYAAALAAANELLEHDPQYALIGTDEYSWAQVIHYKPARVGQFVIAPEGAGGSIVGQVAATGAGRKRGSIRSTVPRYSSKPARVIERDGSSVLEYSIEHAWPVTRDGVPVLERVMVDGKPARVVGLDGLERDVYRPVYRTMRKVGHGPWHETKRARRGSIKRARAATIERDTIAVDSLESLEQVIDSTLRDLFTRARSTMERHTRRIVSRDGSITTTIVADPNQRTYAIRTTRLERDSTSSKTRRVSDRTTARSIGAATRLAMRSHARATELLEALEQ